MKFQFQLIISASALLLSLSTVPVPAALALATDLPSDIQALSASAASVQPPTCDDLGIDLNQDSCRAYCSSLGYDGVTTPGSSLVFRSTSTSRCMCKGMNDNTLKTICQSVINETSSSPSTLTVASSKSNTKLSYTYKYKEKRQNTNHDGQNQKQGEMSPETDEAKEHLKKLWDEDTSAPTGPDEGWPHTPPFHLNETTFPWEVDEVIMDIVNNQNINLPIIRVTQIARPEGSETAYYTGVTHFRHVNNPKLITLLFSAGRHDGGSNTYLTIDTSSGNTNPFIGAQEQFIDASDVSTYTWVSSFTLKDTADGSKVLHYALFSGGNGGGEIGPSKMYAVEEDTNGQLQEPQLVWIQDTKDTEPARSCLLADLGDIYDGNDVLVSKAGVPDIIISGLGGIDIYSQTGGEGDWKLVRSLPLVNAFSSDNLAGASSYVGVALGDDQRLAISSRSRWNITNQGLTPNSPCVLWDYANDRVVGTFSSNAQTVSVDYLHDSSQILVGAGGEADYSAQPNLFLDIMGKDDASKIYMSDTQLVKDSPTSYGPTEEDDNFTPTSPFEYFTVPESGLTKTRQVKSFSLFGVEVVLEVNSGQPCNIYQRKSNLPSNKILPLPGSEGYIDPTYGGVYARAGDVIVIDDMVYVVLANYNGNNKVYSFSIQWFKEQPRRLRGGRPKF